MQTGQMIVAERATSPAPDFARRNSRLRPRIQISGLIGLFAFTLPVVTSQITRLEERGGRTGVIKKVTPRS